MTPELYQSSSVILPLSNDWGSSDFSRFSRTVIQRGEFSNNPNSVHYNSSLQFNGVNSMLEFRVDNIDLATDDYTVGFWVRFDDYLQGGSVFSHLYEATTDRMPLAIGFTDGVNYGNGNVLTIGYYTGSWSFFTIPDFSLNLSQWYHFSVTREETGLSFFLNGTRVGGMDIVTPPVPSTKPMLIGRRWDTGGVKNYFTGSINDFFISNTVLWRDAFTPPDKFIGKITNEGSNPLRFITGEVVDTVAAIFPRESSRIFRTGVVGGYYSAHVPKVESDVVFLSPTIDYQDLCFSRVTPC